MSRLQLSVASLSAAAAMTFLPTELAVPVAVWSLIAVAWFSLVQGGERRELGDDQRYAAWRWQELWFAGAHYMTKLYLARCPLAQASVHLIRAPDPGRDMHDHPRSFVSIVLRGGYVEERPAPATVEHELRLEGNRYDLGLSVHGMPTRTARRGLLSVAFRRATDAHRIVEVDPGTVTLVLWGPHRRSWGFHTAIDWVFWRTYLQSLENIIPRRKRP